MCAHRSKLLTPSNIPQHFQAPVFTLVTMHEAARLRFIRLSFLQHDAQPSRRQVSKHAMGGRWTRWMNMMIDGRLHGLMNE